MNEEECRLIEQLSGRQVSAGVRKANQALLESIINGAGLKLVEECGLDEDTFRLRLSVTGPVNRRTLKTVEDLFREQVSDACFGEWKIERHDDDAEIPIIASCHISFSPDDFEWPLIVINALACGGFDYIREGGWLNESAPEAERLRILARLAGMTDDEVRSWFDRLNDAGKVQWDEYDCGGWYFDLRQVTQQEALDAFRL